MNRTMQRAAQRRRSTYTQPFRQMPLPMRGILSETGNAHVKQAVAEDLTNLWSDGFSIYVRDGFTYSTGAERPRQRVPFEFGIDPKYLLIYEDRATDGVETLTRAFPNRVMSATVSNNVVVVDGAGQPVLYNGTTIAESEFTITNTTGDDPATMNGVIAHHDRLIFWDTRAKRPVFYYTETVGAITGPLIEFPLDRLGNIKGAIVSAHSYTVDAAHGTNDVLVLTTTTGQSIVYEGLDPGDPLDWRLFGRCQTAVPVSRFAVTNFGADAFLLTTEGAVQIRMVIQQGQQALPTTLTRAVRDDIRKAVRANRDSEDWGMQHDPDGRFILINIPEPDGTFRQLVYSFESQGWFPWVVSTAREWHTLVTDISFTGTDGRLGEWGSEGDDGEKIPIIFETGWFDLLRETTLSCLKIHMLSVGNLDLTIIMLSDNHETPRDIEAQTQEITILPQDETEPTLIQNHDEEIGLDIDGTTFKLKFTSALMSGQLVKIELR